MSEVEYAVVILVVGARLLLPLTIPYFPVPGAIACLLLDSIIGGYSFVSVYVVPWTSMMRSSPERV